MIRQYITNLEDNVANKLIDCKSGSGDYCGDSTSLPTEVINIDNWDENERGLKYLLIKQEDYDKHMDDNSFLIKTSFPSALDHNITYNIDLGKIDNIGEKFISENEIVIAIMDINSIENNTEKESPTITINISSSDNSVCKKIRFLLQRCNCNLKISCLENYSSTLDLTFDITQCNHVDISNFNILNSWFGNTNTILRNCLIKELLIMSSAVLNLSNIQFKKNVTVLNGIPNSDPNLTHSYIIGPLQYLQDGAITCRNSIEYIDENSFKGFYSLTGSTTKFEELISRIRMRKPTWGDYENDAQDNIYSNDTIRTFPLNSSDTTPKYKGIQVNSSSNDEKKALNDLLIKYKEKNLNRKYADESGFVCVFDMDVLDGLYLSYNNFTQESDQYIYSEDYNFSDFTIADNLIDNKNYILDCMIYQSGFVGRDQIRLNINKNGDNIKFTLYFNKNTINNTNDIILADMAILYSIEDYKERTKTGILPVAQATMGRAAHPDTKVGWWISKTFNNFTNNENGFYKIYAGESNFTESLGDTSSSIGASGANHLNKINGWSVEWTHYDFNLADVLKIDNLYWGNQYLVGSEAEGFPQITHLSKLTINKYVLEEDHVYCLVHVFELDKWVGQEDEIEIPLTTGILLDTTSKERKYFEHQETILTNGQFKVRKIIHNYFTVLDGAEQGIDIGDSNLYSYINFDLNNVSSDDLYNGYAITISDVVLYDLTEIFGSINANNIDYFKDALEGVLFDTKIINHYHGTMGNPHNDIDSNEEYPDRENYAFTDKDNYFYEYVIEKTDNYSTYGLLGTDNSYTNTYLPPQYSYIKDDSNKITGINVEHYPNTISLNFKHNSMKHFFYIKDDFGRNINNYNLDTEKTILKGDDIVPICKYKIQEVSLEDYLGNPLNLQSNYNIENNTASRVYQELAMRTNTYRVNPKIILDKNYREEHYTGLEEVQLKHYPEAVQTIINNCWGDIDGELDRDYYITEIPVFALRAALIYAGIIKEPEEGNIEELDLDIRIENMDELTLNIKPLIIVNNTCNEMTQNENDNSVFTSTINLEEYNKLENVSDQINHYYVYVILSASRKISDENAFELTKIDNGDSSCLLLSNYDQAYTSARFFDKRDDIWFDTYSDTKNMASYRTHKFPTITIEVEDK